MISREVLDRNNERRKANNYKYEKTPEARINRIIKRQTRHRYPLEGQTCEWPDCNKAAEERHHTTNPIAIDNFVYLCKSHHLQEHQKLRLQKRILKQTNKITTFLNSKDNQLVEVKRSKKETKK